MSKIQCFTCGGMTDVGNASHGTCEYCGCAVGIRRISSFSGISITEFNAIRNNAAVNSGNDDGNAPPKDLVLALCYLKTGNFILAKKKLAAVIEEYPECCEAYYYYALTIINGRRLAEITMKEARSITQYLQSAIALDDSFIFPKLLFALLCIEYYEENGLSAPADGREILSSLNDSNVDREELNFFSTLVKTDIV